MCYLFLLSIFSTSIRSVKNYSGDALNPEWGRYIYFLADNPIKHLFIILSVIFILLILKSFMNEKKGIIRHKAISSKTICVFFFLFSCWFVLNTQFYPKSDPGKMLRIAQEILNGDYHEFAKEGYMYRYPYQSGFVLYCMLALKIFNQYAFLMLQIFNAAFLTAMYFFLTKCAELLWECKRHETINTLVYMLCSIPLFFYITFIYGNIPGLSLAVIAIYFELRFFRESKFKWILGASLCMGIAVAFKSNCMIFMIAMLIVLLMNFLQKRKMRDLLTAVLLILLCYIIINKGVCLTMENLAGVKLSQGMPKSAFVMMGLEEGMAAPGVENGSSNRIFEENGYDYALTDKAAKELIIARMKTYVTDWKLGIDFFARKQAAQCNEATYQCFSIIEERKTEVVVPSSINYFIMGRGKYQLTEFLNIIQSIIIFGVCAYIFSFNSKKQKIDELIFLLVYIGGFVFQIFWEAKSQYLLIFFFVLLPYMIKGYSIIVERLYNFIRKIDLKMFNRKKIFSVVAGAVLCILTTISLMNSWTFNHVIKIQSDEMILQEYYEIMEEEK